VTRAAVIVPHYRQPAYLAACLESLLAQTRPADEIVVVDSSPDETTTIMPRYAGRVRHLVRPADGVAAARNAGLAATTCDLVSFLDADNMATPDRLARQVHALAERPDAVLCHGMLVPIDCKGHDYRMLPAFPSEQVPFGRQLGWLIERNRIATDTVCVRRDAVAAVGGFCESPGVREDYDLWLRLASVGPFAYLDSPLALYRRHESNLSNDETYMFQWEAGALKRIDWETTARALSAAFPSEADRAVVEAEVHLRRGDVDLAEIQFVALSRRKPPVPAACFHRANLAIDRGLLIDAEGLLRRAMKQDPGDAALWNNLGTLLVRSGRREQAADAFARAVALRPHYEDARQNFAQVHRSADGPWKITRRRLRQELLPLAAVAN